MTSAVRRMSLTCALRNGAHAAQDALTGRPAPAPLLALCPYPLGVARALTALCTNRVPSGRLLAPDVRDRIDWQERQRYRQRFPE